MLYVTDQLDLILTILVSLDYKVDNLIQRVDTRTVKPSAMKRETSSLENMSKVFPLKTREDIYSFEEQLENTAMRNEFVSK